MSRVRRINPAMIALARESRGWTQKNLADAIDVSQAKICKYELGIHEVADEDAQTIAKVLDYDISLLYRHDHIFALGHSLVFHRKRVRIPVREQTRVQAEINIRRMQIVRLLKGADVELEHGFPLIPADEFGGNIEHVAERVRGIWDIPEGPITDLVSIVENAGGIILLVDFGTTLIDGIHIWTAGFPPIFMMNKKSPGERFRFSLAHEIGHAVMHQAASLHQVEDEANRFASAFLLPRKQVRFDLRSLNLESAARLKRIWKVSMQALIMRAKELNQITESTARRLFMSLGKRGYRTNEPWPIPLEEPRLFGRLMDFHRHGLGMGPEDLRKILFTADFGPLDRPTKRMPKLRLAQDESSS